MKDFTRFCQVSVAAVERAARRRAAPWLLTLLLLAVLAASMAVAAPQAQAAGTLAGTVTDEFSAPLPGIRVDIYRYDGWDWYQWTTRWTNGIGIFTASLPAGDYTCLYTDVGAAVYGSEYYQDESYLYDADTVTVTNGGGVFANAMLDPAAHIDGYVYDEFGDPLEGVYVEVYRSTGRYWDVDPYLWGYTDASGHYTISGAGIGRGDYTFRYVDDSGAEHATQWYNGEYSMDDADYVYCDYGGSYTLGDIYMEPGATISGSVYDTFGYPLGGWWSSWVDIYRYNETYDYWEWVAFDFPGIDGGYSVSGLAPGYYRVGFGAYGYVDQYYDHESEFDWADVIGLEPGDVATNIDGELARLGGITGHVYDPNGEPLAGVDIEVWGNDGDTYDYVADATTDSTGVYYVQGLSPADDYRVHFTAETHWGGQTLPDEWWNDMPTRRDGDDVAVVPDRLTRNIDAHLSPWGNVTGKVADEGGTPLAGVEVSAWQYDGAGWDYAGDTTTDSTGAYNLDELWRGKYKIRFGGEWGPQRMEWWNDRPDRQSADLIRVHNGRTTGGIDAQLSTPATISGTVWDDPDGIKWPQALVYAYRADGSHGRELAGLAWTWYGGGDYTISGLAAGTYRLYAWDYSDYLSSMWHSDAATIDDADPITVADGDDYTGADFKLPAKGSLGGTVTDPGGALLGGIQIEAYQDKGGGDWEYIADASTDSTGAYEIDGLGEGSYKVRFRDGTFAFAPQWFDGRQSMGAADTVPVVGGSLTPGVDAVLEGSSSISGHVTDPGGDPQGGVEVQVWASDGHGGWEYVWDTSGWGFTETDHNGEYRVVGLPPGDYRVGFQPDTPDYAREFWKDQPNLQDGDTLTVGPKDKVTDIDAKLDWAGSISGQVVDNGKNPLSDVVAVVWQPDGSGGWQELDGDATDNWGQYRIGGLNEGTYRVQFFDEYDIYYPVWYYQQPDLGSAQDVSVSLDDNTDGIDAVLDHPSDIVDLQSASHPSQDTWYSNNDPQFNWVPRDGAETAGYSWGLDDYDRTTPPKTNLGDLPFTGFTDVPDGEWRFHVRGANLDNSWGPASHYRVRIDTTPPVSSDDNTGDWYKSPAVYHLSATDAHSGVASTEWNILGPGGPWLPGATATVAGTGTATLYYRSTDNAGNVESPARTTAIKVDGTAPTTTISGNDANWHKDPVTVTFTPTDAQSGMAGGSAKTEYRLDSGSWTTGTSLTVSANGSHTVDYRSTDKVGNVEAFKSATVLIDTVAPTTSDNSDGAWHAVPVSVTLTPTDPSPGSGMSGGLAKTEYRLDGGPWTTGTTVNVAAPTDHANDGSHAILYRSTDAVGNLEATGGATVKIDTTAPNTTDDTDGAWHDSDVTVHFTATDAGSGVEHTEYSTDGGTTWTTGTAVVVVAPADHSGDGVHEILYRSFDNLGWQEDVQSCEVKIETDAPVTTDDADGLWHNTDVTVHFTATDPDSGVDYTEWSSDGGTTWTHGASVTIAADLVGHTTDGVTTISYRSVDELGHTEPTKTCTVSIDTQRPTTKPLAKASVRKGRKATFKYRVNDPVPGSPTATVTIKVKKRSGKVVKTLKPGIKNVNVPLSYKWRCKLKKGKYRWWIYATDTAGNVQATIGKGYLTVK